MTGGSHAGRMAAVGAIATQATRLAVIPMAILALALTTGLAACGGGDDEAEDARRMITTMMPRLQKAFQAKNADAVCGGLARHAKLMLGSSAHRTPTDCSTDIQSFLKWIRAGDGDSARSAEGAPKARITQIEVDGDRATATATLPDGSTVGVPFVEENGQWKLRSLFNAGLSLLQLKRLGSAQRTPDDYRQTVAAPPHADPSLAVWDSGAQTPATCAQVEVTSAPRIPAVRGGCVVTVSGTKLDLSVNSPFGVMRFGRCDVSYRMHVDGDGSVWIERVNINGPSPCADAFACSSKLGATAWAGQIRRDGGGGLRLDVADACLDTCVGKFRGDWRLELIETARGWRLWADKAPIGTSGWVFDGAVESKGRGFAIKVG